MSWGWTVRLPASWEGCIHHPWGVPTKLSWRGLRRLLPVLAIFAYFAGVSDVGSQIPETLEVRPGVWLGGDIKAYTPLAGVISLSTVLIPKRSAWHSGNVWSHLIARGFWIPQQELVALWWDAAWVVSSSSWVHGNWFQKWEQWDAYQSFTL